MYHVPAAQQSDRQFTAASCAELFIFTCETQLWCICKLATDTHSKIVGTVSGNPACIQTARDQWPVQAGIIRSSHNLCVGTVRKLVYGGCQMGLFCPH